MKTALSNNKRKNIHTRSEILQIQFTSETIIYSLSFLIVFGKFDETIPYYITIRYIMLLIVGLFFCLKFKFIMSKSSLTIFTLWIIFGIAIIGSSFLSRNDYPSRNPFLASIVFFGGITELLCSFQYATTRHQIDKLLNIFFCLGTLILLWTDLFIFFYPDTSSYLIGNKFSVSYFHMFVLTLWASWVYRKNKTHFLTAQIIGIILLGLTLITETIIDCMTGIVGLFLLTIWYFFGRAFPRFLCNPITAVTAVLFSYIFIYASNAILRIPLVLHFIENYLHHDATLSYRTVIFSVIPNALSHKPLLGYGYGISYEVMSIQGKGFIPDTQNGFAEWLLYGGWITGLILLALIAYIFYTASQTHEFNNSTLLFIALIYTFICMATVEITFTEEFFATLTILYALSTYRKQLRRKDAEN